MLHATHHGVGCSAWRRRHRRLRAFWRHEQQAVRLAVAAATHHSYDKSIAHACTQTDDEVRAAAFAATVLAPVIVFVASAPVTTDIADFLQPPIPIVTPAPSVTPTPTDVQHQHV